MIGSICNEFSTINTSEKYRKIRESSRGDDVEIVEVSVSDIKKGMSVDNGFSADVCVINVRNYQQSNLVMRIEQIDYSYTLPRDVSLSCVPSVRTSFRMHRFDHTRGKLSVVSHAKVICDGVAMPATTDMTVSRLVLKRLTKVVLLDIPHRLEAM